MNKNTYTAVILTATLFSGASFAQADNEEDILTGNGMVVATMGAPYTVGESKSNETDSDILSNLGELKFPVGYVPGAYEPVHGAMDNIDDMIRAAS